MMHTRCPTCNTVFRVTPEQLRLKAGKVRCGNCKGVFNAFDGLLQEGDLAQPPTPASPPTETKQKPPAETSSHHEPPKKTDKPEIPSKKSVEQPPKQPEKETPQNDKALLLEPFIEEHIVVEVLEEPLSETPEESTQAARDAGLVAARGLSDTPGYSRWAEEALIGADDEAFESEPVQRSTWPFILAIFLLLLALSAQLLIYYKTEITLHLPSTKSLYDALRIKVPLPNHADLVAITSSDLRADKANGFLILDAVLHNRANYAQAWPAIELTLKDATNTPFSRRVLNAADYLPPNISPERFPADGEVAVRLWINAKEIDASGYGLYIFYP